MDGSSSQGFRHHSRNNRTIQPRPEWGRRKGKSNDHGESQGYYCRGKARQKAMDGNRGYGRVSQESQSNKCNCNYTLRALARRQTQPLSSQNYRFNSVCPHSKGKTHQTRYPLAQGNSGRLRRHEPVQGMGFDKERRCGIEGRGIHRRETSQPNPSSLRGTQNYLRLDHGLARTTRNERTKATTTDAASDREGRFRFGRTRAGHGRPSDLIARIYGERIPRISKRVSKRVSKRASNWWVNKRVNKDVGKTKQGHPYLYEVRTRKLRQKARTNPHGKGGKEHQPRRRRRTCNDAGSYQSPHAREAVGGSISKRIRVSDQKSYLGSCS